MPIKSVSPADKVCRTCVTAAWRTPGLSPSEEGNVRGPVRREMPSTQDPRLIETAVKFSEPSESVRIACGAASDPIVVTIDSHGKTIPIDQIPKFFDLFSISEVSTPGGDLGLGPPVAFRILALFDGAVTVANRD